MKITDINEAASLAINLNWLRETRQYVVGGEIRTVQLRIKDAAAEWIELANGDYEAVRKIFLDSLNREIDRDVKRLRQLGVEVAA